MGVSFPGFPVVVAGLLLLSAIVLVGLSVWWSGGTRRWIIPATGIIRAGGILVTSANDAPPRGRWAASAAAFDAQVAALRAPGALETSQDGLHFVDLPSSCPSPIGTLAIGGCLAVDGGYLFLQAQGALTDSSGIVYLPQGNRPDSTGLRTDGLTALGGPWWARTSNC